MNESKTPRDGSEERPTGESPKEVWLPPRLRDKLGDADTGAAEWKPKSGSPLPAILVTLVIVGLAVGGFVWWRSSARKAPEASPPAPETTAAVSESLAAVARSESLAAIARADSVARAASAVTKTTGAGTPTRAPSGPSSPGASTQRTPSSPPAETPRPATNGFGIAVGSFIFEDKANSERDRLAGVTGLPGIVRASEGSFEVILGKFTTRASAESKAAALMDSSLVREARVVARPK